MYEKLLVPVDKGVENNTRALKEAAENAVETDGEIYLLFSWVNEDQREQEQPDEGEPEPIAHAREYLEEYDVDVNADVTLGDPAEEIVFYAAEHNVDAIVMATYARTGIHRMVIGSVTEETIRQSSRPVIAVTPEE